jgi:hypothetical protein
MRCLVIGDSEKGLFYVPDPRSPVPKVAFRLSKKDGFQQSKDTGDHLLFCRAWPAV